MQKRTSLLFIFILGLLTLSVVFTLKVHAQTEWQPNTSYTAGDLVTYGGHTYKCIQSHTSLVGWEPPNVPALWQDLGTSSGGGSTATPIPTDTPGTGPTATQSSGGGNCWTPYVPGNVYTGGMQVSYNGENWTAKWWTQNEAPSTGGSGVWQDQGSCSGGVINPTPTFVPPTPSGNPTTIPSGGQLFAPYIDVSPGSGSAIMQLANNGSGNRHYSLAFILGYGCNASWFGAYQMNTAEADAIGTRINELRAAGGDVIVSFGGAAAPELANVCSDVASLQAQYQAVVSKYNLSMVDFDIEDFSPTAIDLRNKALRGLEAANPGLQVHYTLGVLESGFTSSQNDVLNNAAANGTRVDLVNIMAMDYGHAVSDMGAAAISAAQAARSQLDSMGFGGTQLGITPMIGVNDSAGETFTLDNASSLASWAASNNIASIGFWSIGRDNGGCPGGGAASASCSGVSQSNFQFSSIFHSFGN